MPKPRATAGDCATEGSAYMDAAELSGLGEVDVTLALSLLLAAGFACARLAKLVHLPSVTGYILAGVLVGPSGFDLIPAELFESRLQMFTTIALLLVAFGIGERFDVGQLRGSARLLVRLATGEVLGTFVLVAVSVGVTAWCTGAGGGGRESAIAIALVSASIAVATAPAATVSVIRELGASGPLSRLILSDIVVNNALSITFFGLSVAAAQALLGTGTGSGLTRVLMPELTTIASLLVGLLVGLITDLVVHKLSSRHDVLVVSLAAVFFCGGIANYTGLSPLLAGVAAGFAVVNRDRRDVRAFRALNDFEPPIYGIFFSLAGAELHLRDMVAAGAIGIAFVVMRAAGKVLGAWVGARSGGMPPLQSRVIGLGLLPQAGLAIGLAYLVRQDETLVAIRSVVINVVVASVVINELLGPPLVRQMLLWAGEVPDTETRARRATPDAGTNADVVPWTWSKLTPSPRSEGTVIAALGNPATAAGVMRIATLLAHRYRATPVALNVAVCCRNEGFWNEAEESNGSPVCEIAHEEAACLGYEALTEVEYAEEVAQGILRSAERSNAQAIVMGHPLTHEAPSFGRVVETVAEDALCPVVVVRFAGALHTERILVPITSDADFMVVRPMVCALAMVMDHSITILWLMAPDASEAEMREKEDAVLSSMARGLPGQVSVRAVVAESRVHEVLQAAEEHDIVVMATGTRRGLRRVFFGSLAEDVALRLNKPMLVVRGGLESRGLDEE